MKNSLACVIFKEKKSTIILRQLEKWENHEKYLTRNPWLFYRVESKLLFSKYKNV